MIYFKNPFFIENKINKNNLQYKNKKFFCLPMFPYPSGKLHIGHARNYILSDVISRYNSLKKLNILHPIAWDAFGLPAENISKNFNLNPEIWTISNIKFMRNQLKNLSISFNKNFEFSTCDIKFYKWEFFLFILLLKNNLLFKKKKKINWDVKEKCILSNEQIKNNVGWRSNGVIVKKEKKTWFINMSLYSKRIYNNLKYNNWSKNIINIQKKWIKLYCLFFFKINFLYINLHLKYINIKKIFLKNNDKLYFLLIKFNNKKIISKKKFFFYNIYFKKREKILIMNYFYKNKNINKIKINYLIKHKKIFFFLKSNLKDWSIERERRWGSPIFFKKVKNNNFKNFKTIDTFFQSSWYYLFYIKTKNILTKKKNLYFPIDIYIGGNEHANLHLIYLRLINQIFFDLNILNKKEIVKNLINQGFVNNEIYYKNNNNEIIYYKKKTKFNNVLIEKMSKSKKNGINPNKIILKYGSDILRLYLITNKPVKKNINWKSNDLKYLKNFILKINNLKFEYNSNVLFNFKNIYNIKKIHKIISFINNIIKFSINKNQKNIILFYLYPIIPNIIKILWYKNNKNFLIQNTNSNINNIKYYYLYYKNKYIKKEKHLLFDKYKKINILIKKINVLSNNNTIIIL